MPLVRRFRVPALSGALAVLICALISRPYADMGGEWTYIRSALRLATTGKILYNGWEAPMLGWQLYLGAAFIKLFGFSITTVRMSTWLVAMTLAFLLQRVMVRAGISERNAVFGTLAFVLSPLYLTLSVCYTSDIFGLFAVVLCLYGCLRALEASTDRACVAWICFAVAGNDICGTARQIVWLGVLVMVPSTLWLLRERRRVLIEGAVATLAGYVFVFACMRWMARQPYINPEHLVVHRGQEYPVLATLFHAFPEVLLLLLPILVPFLPEIRKSLRRSAAVLSVLSLAYLLILLVLRWKHITLHPLLEPTLGDVINVSGINVNAILKGTPPVFLLNHWVRLLLTATVASGLIGLAASMLRTGGKPLPEGAPRTVSWAHLGVILVPFSVVYSLILIPRAGQSLLVDRYLLELALVAAVCVVRYYQDCLQPKLPGSVLFLTGLLAIYGIACTHNTYSFYRARVRLAAELRAAGVPDTSVDNGWEYNIAVELQHADYINWPAIVIPAHAYVPQPPLPAGTCPMFFHDVTPHIIPLYGVSFDPNACYGPAPFAPVHYSRWPYRTRGTLYVVRYLPPKA